MEAKTAANTGSGDLNRAQIFLPHAFFVLDDTAMFYFGVNVNYF